MSARKYAQVRPLGPPPMMATVRAVSTLLDMGGELVGELVERVQERRGGLVADGAVGGVADHLGERAAALERVPARLADRDLVRHRGQPRQPVAARNALSAGLGGSGMQKRRLGDDGADARRHRLDAAGETLDRRAQTRIGGGTRLDREQRHGPIPLRIRPPRAADPAFSGAPRTSRDNR